MQCLPYAWLILFGSAPLLFITELPNQQFLVIGLVLGLLLFRAKHRAIHYLGAILLVSVWANYHACQLREKIDRFSDRHLQTEVLVSERQVNKQRIRVVLVKVKDQIQFPRYSAWLSVDNPEAYQLGQRWAMRLRLRPVHSLLNQRGYDTQRNALANGTPFTGKILEQTLLIDRPTWRQWVITRFETNTAQSAWAAISRALLFGLRDTIPPAISRLFQETGVAHLMAISGMHIGLVYGIGWFGLRLLQIGLPTRFAQQRVAMAGGWLLSLFYCLLSGGQPSALRAMLALSIWQITRNLGLNFTSFQVLLCCIAGLLFIDPLIILSDSLWLSALAVFALLLWYRWFPLPARFVQKKRWYGLRLLHLQLGIMVIMLPAQVWFFHGTSLSALTSNLIAIPLVGLVVLPLALIMLLPWPTLLFTPLLTLHDAVLKGLVELLTLHGSHWLWLSQPLFAALISWGLLLAVRCHWWRSFPISCLALVFVLFTVQWAPNFSKWRITMLDVGHGLALVISQGSEALIYDTGNRWREGDVGERILVPWLRNQQLTPYQVILSHRHLDHTGGLTSLLKAWPKLPVRTAYSYPGSLPCRRGVTWQWQRLTLRVLWPLSSDTPGQNNDSCVIQISDGRYSLLLTGDLEKQAEQQLIALEKQAVASTWLQVPHHGSNTSSSALFLRNVRPEAALASVARYNPWRFPAKKVIERYQGPGYRWLETATAGQISIEVGEESYQILQMRDQISPRWYHQWFGGKPDYR